jgi:hypothetical protein
MLVHRIFAPMKRALPRSLTRSVRAVFTAFLTPISFSLQTGHFRSALSSKAIDAQGNPIPWYSYAALDLLRARACKFAGRSVLEFGAGQSTLWWARQAEKVVSFEADASWYAHLSKEIPANVSLYLVDDKLPEFEKLVPADARFDVIIVDGLNRAIAAAKSYQMLKPGGLFILDNAEGFWGAEGSYPILDLMRNAGFARVDFYGISPANIMPSCTSFFFRNTCFLFEGEDPPKRWALYT